VRVGASAFTHPAALVACLAAVIGFAVFAGCAEQPMNNPVGPLSSVTVDGIVYTVKSARVLNPGDPEDRIFLDGRRPAAGRTFVGLFLVMCNDASSLRRSSDDLRLSVEPGSTASRIEREGSPLSYEPQPLTPRECAPRPSSAPGRAAGALLALFDLPDGAAPRRPLDFGVEALDGSVRRVRVVSVGE
jgi:hypothetical protein